MMSIYIVPKSFDYEADFSLTILIFYLDYYYFRNLNLYA